MGAEAIKIKPSTAIARAACRVRALFPMFNRNKEHRGRPAQARRCRGSACRQRRRGGGRISSPARWAYGLDYAARSQVNPRLIYVVTRLSSRALRSSDRARRGGADDGGSRTTGRPGDPLRAGPSVNDIMGGMSGDRRTRRADPARYHRQGHGSAVGIVREQRVPDGPAHAPVRNTRQHPAPMPARESPWAIYDVHRRDGEQIFLCAVSDAQ